jgi:hypothetical protein
MARSGSGIERRRATRARAEPHETRMRDGRESNDLHGGAPRWAWFTPEIRSENADYEGPSALRNGTAIGGHWPATGHGSAAACRDFPTTRRPSVLSIAPQGSHTFTALSSGGMNAWSLSANNSGGTINAATGAYTAGSNPAVTDTIQVKDQYGNLGTLSVQVTAGVSIKGPGTVLHGATANFTASGGSGQGWQWSLPGMFNGSGSTITNGGVYTAGPMRRTSDRVKVVDALGNSTYVTVDVF